MNFTTDTEYPSYKNETQSRETNPFNGLTILPSSHLKPKSALIKVETLGCVQSIDAIIFTNSPNYFISPLFLISLAKNKKNTKVISDHFILTSYIENGT